MMQQRCADICEYQTCCRQMNLITSKIYICAYRQPLADQIQSCLTYNITWKNRQLTYQQEADQGDSREFLLFPADHKLVGCQLRT